MMNLGTGTTASLVQNMQKSAGLNDRAGKAASALEAAIDSRDDKRATQAAEDFESVFIGEMLKPLFNTVEVDETFGGGKGEEIFRDMMVQEYGRMIARQGGIGIASQIRAELLRAQETAHKPVPTGDF